MEIISSDLTDVMRRVEPSQVITQQSQFLTININLSLQKQREESTSPGYLLLSSFWMLIVKIKPHCEQSSQLGKYCFQIIK